MKDRDYLIHELLSIVDNAMDRTNDVVIARAFLEQRNEIDSWTQEDIAGRYYVSQASISRFIHKLGFRNYYELKEALKHSDELVRAAYGQPAGAFDPVRAEIHDTLQHITEDILALKKEDTERIVSRLRAEKKIYFIGSQLSMSIVRLLQLKLTSMGKTVYAISNFRPQPELIAEAEKDSLLVIVSLGQRHFRILHFEELLAKAKCRKMLWCCTSQHDGAELFDDIAVMGETEDGDLGYHYLMQYLLIIYKLL